MPSSLARIMRRPSTPLLVGTLLALIGTGPNAMASLGDQATSPAETPAKSQAATSEFPAEWFWDVGGSTKRFAAMVGKAPPPLTVKSWRGEPRDLAALKGNVVVVEFWATWCPPCRESMPHMVELVKAKEAEGLVVIGVHDSKRGSEKMLSFAEQNKVNFSLAVDDATKSEKAWKVSFWPTIAVIDRTGVIRAIGLQPDFVDEVVEKLLKEPASAGTTSGSSSSPAKDAPPAQTPAKPATPAAPAKDDTKGTGASSFIVPARLNSQSKSPAAEGDAGKQKSEQSPTKPNVPSGTDASSGDANDPWRFTEGKPERRTQLASLLGSTPKEIDAKEWLNTDPLTMASLKGKVVVLDFWATWCGPCIKSIPHTNELHEKYKDKVVIIGVCHPRGGEQMAAVVKSKEIKYPVVRLPDDAVLAHYKVDGYPDYLLIDKEGKVRIPDCRNDMVEQAIESLLK